MTTGSCRVSYYDGRQRTANGETLDGGALTAAHRSLPFDSRLTTFSRQTLAQDGRGQYCGDRGQQRGSNKSSHQFSSGQICRQYSRLSASNSETSGYTAAA